MAEEAGRVAMISGANRGIGAAVAQELAANGWRVSLGVRRPDSLPEALQANAAAVHAYDALAPEAAEAWVDATAARLGRIDAVVNNAGVMIPKSVVEISDTEIDTLLGVNVKGPLRLGRAAWPHLCASGQGRIVTLASLSGKRIKTAATGSYAVSKFAAVALAHAFRLAGYDQGVRSTAICPGFVATDMAQALVSMDPAEMTQPSDLARLVRTVIELPNTASVAELPVNCRLEDSF